MAGARLAWRAHCSERTKTGSFRDGARCGHGAGPRPCEGSRAARPVPPRPVELGLVAGRSAAAARSGRPRLGAPPQGTRGPGRRDPLRLALPLHPGRREHAAHRALPHPGRAAQPLARTGVALALRPRLRPQRRPRPRRAPAGRAAGRELADRASRRHQRHGQARQHRPAQLRVEGRLQPLGPLPARRAPLYLRGNPRPRPARRWEDPSPDRWPAGVKRKLLEVFGPELDLPDLPKQWRAKHPVLLH